MLFSSLAFPPGFLSSSQSNTKASTVGSQRQTSGQAGGSRAVASHSAASCWAGHVTPQPYSASPHPRPGAHWKLGIEFKDAEGSWHREWLKEIKFNFLFMKISRWGKKNNRRHIVKGENCPLDRWSLNRDIRHRVGKRCRSKVRIINQKMASVCLGN